MTTSLHYRLRKLSGTIEELGERRDNGPADALDSVHHSVIRVRESGGVVALENVVVPVQVEACLAPGVRCELYLVEAQAQICSPAYRKCAVDGAFSHVFAIVCGDQCVDAIGPTVRHFGELKQFGMDQVLSWAGLSLLVSFIAIGIPFLIYFGIQTLVAVRLRIPSVPEMKGFLGQGGFPVGCGCQV
jgi:hypothetical protein